MKMIFTSLAPTGLIRFCKSLYRGGLVITSAQAYLNRNSRFQYLSGQAIFLIIITLSLQGFGQSINLNSNHTFGPNNVSFNGTYSYDLNKRLAYFNGYPLLWCETLKEFDMSHLGIGYATVQVYLQFSDGAWRFFGDILYSTSGRTQTGGTFGQSLPTYFNGYLPKCGTNNQTTVTGDCTPDISGITPAGYSYYSGEFTSVERVNGKNQFLLIKPNQVTPTTNDETRIYFDGTKWVWSLEEAVASNLRTNENLISVVISENASTTTGDNPPCSGWTNGFALTGRICDVLPVTLTQFTAKLENNITHLQWTTTEEINSDRFEIEHSANVRDWQKIGEVSSKGQSNALMTYSYTHTGPFNKDNYYRLKMIDNDGTYSYSRIQNVKLELENETAVTYPNPAQDRLFIQVESIDKISKVSISDLFGRTLQESTQDLGKGVVIKNLKPGLYIVHILQKNGVFKTQKFYIER